MNKASAGRFFEDFELGATLACPPARRVGEGAVAAYVALTGDRTAALCGRDAPLHPLVVFHTVLSQTVRPVSFNAKANLGYAELVLRRPVPVGAVIRTEAEVVGLRETSSGRTGIVWVRTAARDDDGPVLSYMRWVMVKKRGDAPTPWRGQDAVIPATAPAVAPADLPAAHKEPTTAGRWFLEDYAVGEVLDHPEGHTVTEAEHMAFTRLFQNTARIHFDAVLTEGRPLVFGGYTMSVGYAQALEGLDNRQGLLAINGGAHTGPVYAGDTLSSRSEVLAVDRPAQALRLALRVRNQRGEGVLDLDYWERMPRR